MHEVAAASFADKPAAYAELGNSLRALLAGESDLIACTANMAALIYACLPDINWAGFYLVEPATGDLLVGPFQGKPACVRIPIGRGVCGSAAASGSTLVVPDVHAFAGHIACDAASNSEIVVPVVTADRLIGVLDIDSPLFARFDQQDADGLEMLVSILLDAISEALHHDDLRSS
jgi:L-methionine (R)-S-oxide reductase